MNNQNMPSHGDDDLLRFEWSVRALAQEAAVQLKLFPEVGCAADELALDFDEHLRKLTALGRVAQLRPEQAQSIEALDQLLAAFSGSQNEHLWTDEALEKAREWNEVRTAAKILVDKMGWSTDPPPADRAIYVGPDA